MKLMTETLENILKANKKYSEKIKNQKKLPHNAKFAIVTCMDERIDPVQFAGLRNNAHVIRNAGGRVTDDVTRLKNHPLVPSNIPIYGYIYDVESGELIKVDKACSIGTSCE